jgi:hypothetical protein
MTINAKVADANQNSYLTVDEADTYMNKKYSTSDWDNLSPSEKETVLINAARSLDNFNYVGDKYYDAQGLAFPRDDHETITDTCGTPITNKKFRSTSLYSDTYMKMPEDYWKYGSCHITSGTPVRDTRLIDSSDPSNGEITVATAFTATPTTNTTFRVFAPIHVDIRNAQCEQSLFLLGNTNIDTIANYRSLGAKRIDIGDVRLDLHPNMYARVPICPDSRKLLSRWIRKNIRLGRG